MVGNGLITSGSVGMNNRARIFFSPDAIYISFTQSLIPKLGSRVKQWQKGGRKLKEARA